MTEYQEICDGKTIEELEIELKYQVHNLGYDLTDSFPSYIQDRINTLKHKAMDNPKGFFICGIEVTEEHIGSKVTYVPQHAHGDASHFDCEGGTIVRWNDGGVFVNYVRNTARTDFRDLVWG